MVPLEQFTEWHAQGVRIFRVQKLQQIAPQAGVHLEPSHLLPSGVQETQASTVIGLKDDLFEVLEQHPVTAFGFAGLEQQARA